MVHVGDAVAQDQLDAVYPELHGQGVGRALGEAVIRSCLLAAKSTAR